MEKLGVTGTEKLGWNLKLFQKGLNFTPVYTLNMLLLLNTNFKVGKRKGVVYIVLDTQILLSMLWFLQKYAKGGYAVLVVQ